MDKALADGVDALVVAGGDGMVHLGVNALAGSGATFGATALGIIPSGTGNDMARALGLPRHNVPAAAARILAALPAGGRVIDAGRVRAGGRTHWFAGVVSAGFDAAVNERANAWRWPRGRARYNLAMLRELATFGAIEYTVTADGERWQQGAMLISVANGQSIGGGMKVVPDAVLDDGTWTCSSSGRCPARDSWRCSPRCSPASTWATRPCRSAGSVGLSWRRTASSPMQTANASGRCR